MKKKNLLTIVDPHYKLLTPLEEIQRYPKVIELAGRTCYKSENRITESSSEDFVKRLVKSGHHSVLEHCSISVCIVGDRSMSHQLVRHRIAAYSQESQRYCDYGKMGLHVILPPKIGVLKPGTYEHRNSNWFGPIGIGQETNLSNSASNQVIEWLDFMFIAYNKYLGLRKNGIPAEDARSVLPNATKTEVVTTYNLRQWRHVFKERALNVHAQWQIRKLMSEILIEFTKIIPSVFEDLSKLLENR